MVYDANQLLRSTVHQVSNALISAAQHSAAQHSTAQHSTAQHSTAQHSTAQLSSPGSLTMIHQTINSISNFAKG